MTYLEQARAAAAVYWRNRGYEKDAKCIEEGRADLSADVQCALTAILMISDPELTPGRATHWAKELVLMRPIPYKEGKPNQ